jgi:hypothetical protein
MYARTKIEKSPKTFVEIWLLEKKNPSPNPPKKHSHTHTHTHTQSFSHFEKKKIARIG